MAYGTLNAGIIDPGSGNSLSIPLGGSAGDDFNVDSGKFVVEGDSGKVGIGTAAPRTNLEIKGANAAVGVTHSGSANLEANTTDSYAIDKGGSLSLGGIYNDAGAIVGFAQIAGRKDTGVDGAVTGYMAISTTTSGGATEKVRIASAGDVTVSLGDIVFGTAGKGIVLGATTNVDANTLDDYEEGTCTLTMIGETTAGASPTTTATYTKIGRMVTVRFMIYNGSTTSAVGYLKWTGLPFTIASAPATRQNVGTISDGGYTSGTSLNAYTSPSTDYFNYIDHTQNAPLAIIAAVGGNRSSSGTIIYAV